jgi:tetratricopeptide (TPR) repeat protein
LQDNNEEKSYELQSLYATISIIPYEKYVDQMQSVLNEWCKKRPNSHIPWLVRGSFHIKYAWLIRGSGFAKTVKKAAWPKFHEKLRLAKKDLERAWELNPNDPNSPSLLIEVAIGLSLPRDVMEQYFQQGISACPWHYDLHLKKLRYLKPKWYGSTNEMSSFAEQCLASSRQYPYLGLVMVDALHESHKYSKTDDNFLGREDIWPTVEKIYAAFFEKYPEDIRRHFYYAFHAIQAKKYDTALEQFETIGDRWIEHTLWDSLDQYNEFRAYAYVKTGEDLLFKQKLYETSINHFQEALRYNPDDHAYCMLGEAYMCSGGALKDLSQLQEAEKNFKKAIEMKGPYRKYAKGELKRLRKYMSRL